MIAKVPADKTDLVISKMDMVNTTKTTVQPLQKTFHSKYNKDIFTHDSSTTSKI